MLGDSHREQSEEMFHAFFVEQLIPANHILRALDKALDTRWVRDEVASCYSATRGRRSWDPEVIVRMMLLGYLYGYSEKRLCDETRMHLGFRWFCRIQPSDPVPDRTTLVKLRNERWQQELWVKILEKSIEACVTAGLVSGRHVAIDGTVIQANAAMGSIEPIEPPLSLRDHLLRQCGWVKFIPPEETPARKTPTDDDPRPGGSADFRGQTRSNATHCSTTDPDAMLYRKGSCTGAQLAYLGHAALDTTSRVVLAVTVTPAHTSAEWDAGAELLDEANARVDDRIEVVSADAGYGVERFLAEVEARGLEAHIPVRGKHDIRPEPTKPVWTRKVVEQAAARRARMKRLAVRGRNRALRAAQTRGYRISRKLRLRIEHLFGEAKTCHGLGRARYRGLVKVQRQMLLTAAVINLKRLAASLGRRRAPANAVAKRVERASCSPLSTLNRLRKALTGLQAALTGILAPALLGCRDALVRA
jgi:IS5 family transposase